MIAGLFVDVARNLSEWSARTLLLEFANAALAGLRQVTPNTTVVNCPRGSLYQARLIAQYSTNQLAIHLRCVNWLTPDRAKLDYNP
jgi:hypothetical protein